MVQGEGKFRVEGRVVCLGEYDRGNFQKTGLAQVRHGGNRSPDRDKGRLPRTPYPLQTWPAGESCASKHTCGALQKRLRLIGSSVWRVGGTVQKFNWFLEQKKELLFWTQQRFRPALWTCESHISQMKNWAWGMTEMVKFTQTQLFIALICRKPKEQQHWTLIFDPHLTLSVSLSLIYRRRNRGIEKSRSHPHVARVQAQDCPTHAFQKPCTPANQHW